MEDVNVIKEFVENKYSIGSIHTIQKLDNNSKVLIDASRGQYILSCLTFPSQLNRLFYVVSFTDYLINKGFPAKKYLKTIDGKLTCKIGDISYQLSEYYKGYTISSNDNYKLTIKQIENAAMSLAQLHLLSTKFKGHKYYKSPFNSNKSRNTLNKIFSMLYQSKNNNQEAELAQIAIKIKLEKIKQCAFEQLAFLKTNCIVNHGDFHAGNIIFDNKSEVRAVIDFEFCVELPKIWDIALSISWLCKESNTEAFSGSLDINKMSVFLGSYNEVYPLTDDEKKSLIQIYLSASYHTTFFLEKFYLSKKSYGLKHCASLNEWFWWTYNIKTVEEAVHSTCK